MFGFKKDASSISNDIQTIVSKENKKALLLVRVILELMVVLKAK
jgi:hypothetical protein